MGLSSAAKPLTPLCLLAALAGGCEDRFEHSKQGQVVDAETGEGIVGIQVRCMTRDDDCGDCGARCCQGQTDCACDGAASCTAGACSSCHDCDDCDYDEEHSKTYTAYQGYFYIPYNKRCQLRFEDVDDDRNGGCYGERRTTFSENDSLLVVELGSACGIDGLAEALE